MFNPNICLNNLPLEYLNQANNVGTPENSERFQHPSSTTGSSTFLLTTTSTLNSVVINNNSLLGEDQTKLACDSNRRINATGEQPCLISISFLSETEMEKEFINMENLQMSPSSFNPSDLSLVQQHNLTSTTTAHQNTEKLAECIRISGLSDLQPGVLSKNSKLAINPEVLQNSFGHNIVMPIIETKAGLLPSTSNRRSSTVVEKLRKIIVTTTNVDGSTINVKPRSNIVPRRKGVQIKQNSFFCSECKCRYQDEKYCPFHVKPDWTILDSEVLPKAVLSLPTQFKLRSSSTNEVGVWTNVIVYKKTVFQPLEGRICYPRDISSEENKNWQHLWKVFGEDSNVIHVISTLDEKHSNWLMYVRPAGNRDECNVMVGLMGEKVRFITTKDIQPDTEMLYWYSPPYCQLLGYFEKPEYSLCANCSERFPDSYSMSQHQISAHTSFTIKWKCNVCQKDFPNSKQLSSHSTKLHGINKKSHICPICKKSFSDPSNLRHHKAIHSTERRFECQWCQRRFKQKAHLKDHLLTHTGEKTWDCIYCDKSFGRKSDRNQHTMLKHRPPESLQKFPCGECNKVFNRKSSLNRHAMYHVGKKSHKCDSCSKSFFTKYHMERHKKSCNIHDPNRE